MTDLETSTQTPVSAALSLPKRAGLWRVLSLAAVAAAVVITTISVLQARDASNVSLPTRPAITLESATVTVSDLPPPIEVAVLGLESQNSRTAFESPSAVVQLPVGAPAVVALYDADTSIVGLALVPADIDRATVEVSARSTASALFALTPGLLNPSMAETRNRVSLVENDPAFAALVDAVRANPNLSSANEAVELAYAELADRIPLFGVLADQGCDSVIARDAYSSAGACVQPQATGQFITNEQDRWALLYSGPASWTDLCAIVAPASGEGSDVLVPSEQCSGDTLMVAPGSFNSQSDNQEAVTQRVRSATAVNSLWFYAGPFAELVGGSAGFTAESTSHIRKRSAEIVGSLSLIVDSDEAFAAAMDVSTRPSTARERHLSAVLAARTLIAASDSTSLIPTRNAGDTQHLDLLDFLARAGERMIANRTSTIWQADSVGMIDFGADA